MAENYYSDYITVESGQTEYYSEAIQLETPVTLTDWAYRKKITISGQSGAGIGYQVKLLIAEQSISGETYDLHLEGHSADFPSQENDGGDLLFVSDNELILLPFWVESISGTYPNRIATIWVRVQDNLDTAKDIWLYYGNSSTGLENRSNGEDTFLFFDDFSGDLSKWSIATGTAIIESGALKVGGSSDNRINTSGFSILDCRIRAKRQLDSQKRSLMAIHSEVNDNYDSAMSYDVSGFDILYNALSSNYSYSLDTNYHIWELTTDTVNKESKGYLDDSYIGNKTDTGTPSGDTVQIRTWDSGHYSYTDWIFVGKFIDNEPAFSSVGAEQDTTSQVVEGDTVTLSDEILLDVSLEKLNLSDPLSLADEILVNLSLEKAEQNESISLSDNITVQSGLFFSDGLNVSDEIDINLSLEKVQESDTINLSDEIETNLSLEKIIESDTINLSDDFQSNLNLEKVLLADEITLAESIIANTPASYATKLVHHNTPFLFIVTDTIPAKIIKVDIGGTTPSFETYELNASGETIQNAKDVLYNETFDLIYVAGANGQLMRINANDMYDREQIDTGDTDDLEKLALYDEWKYLYVGTSDTEGEIIVLDEAEKAVINTNFVFNIEFSNIINTQLNIVKASFVNTKFHFNYQPEYIISTDLRFLTLPPETPSPPPSEDITNLIPPLSRDDFRIYIDGTLVPDVDYESIVITHTVDLDSVAEFTLGRYHDKPNYTLDNQHIEITDSNAVEIRIDGKTLFAGFISNLDFSGSSENIKVTATFHVPTYEEALLDKDDSTVATELLKQGKKSTQTDIWKISKANGYDYGNNILIAQRLPTFFDSGDSWVQPTEPVYDHKYELNSVRRVYNFNTVNLPLAERTRRRHLYDIVLDDITIDNPILDPNDTNPPHYNGILVDLGLDELEFSWFNGMPYTVEELAYYLELNKSVEDPTQKPFVPDPDYTYFWTIGAYNVVEKRYFSGYVGTSLGSFSSGLWQIQWAHYYRQRIEENWVFSSEEFRNNIPDGREARKEYFENAPRDPYYIGNPPYKEISTRNGSYTAKWRYVDRPDGLYKELHAQYNYKAYARSVALIE